MLLLWKLFGVIMVLECLMWYCIVNWVNFRYYMLYLFFLSSLFFIFDFDCYTDV
jgi:hypothetical protein